MFKKHLNVKKVTRYQTPAYPVVEDGLVISTPTEKRLSDLAKEIAKPVLPLAFAFVTESAEGAEIKKPAVQLTLQESKTSKDSTEINTTKQESKIPIHIRRFSDREIEALVKELSIVAKVESEGMGGSARFVTLTESQGCKILMKFFEKNGITLKEEVDFNKKDVKFKIDGYNSEKKVGYEFVNITGESDLVSGEIDKLEKGIDGENILIVKGARQRIPKPQEAILILQQKAEAFLIKLYEKGVIGRLKEIKECIAKSGSKEEKESLKAIEELKKIGVEAILSLNQAINQIDKNQVSDKEKKQLKDRLQAVSNAIYEKEILPCLKQLDDEDSQVRDQATQKLVELGEPVRTYVEQWLNNAKKTGNIEVREKCNFILDSIR